MLQTGSEVYLKDHVLCSDAHPVSDGLLATYLKRHLRQVLDLSEPQFLHMQNRHKNQCLDPRLYLERQLISNLNVTVNTIYDD